MGKNLEDEDWEYIISRDSKKRELQGICRLENVFSVWTLVSKNVSREYFIPDASQSEGRREIRRKGSKRDTKIVVRQREEENVCIFPSSLHHSLLCFSISFSLFSLFSLFLSPCLVSKSIGCFSWKMKDIKNTGMNSISQDPLNAQQNQYWKNKILTGNGRKAVKEPS